MYVPSSVAEVREREKERVYKEIAMKGMKESMNGKVRTRGR